MKKRTKNNKNEILSPNLLLVRGKRNGSFEEKKKFFSITMIFKLCKRILQKIINAFLFYDKRKLSSKERFSKFYLVEIHSKYVLIIIC